MKYTLEVEVGGQNLQLAIDYTPAREGQYSGPPEDCYEDEPSELVVERIDLVLHITEDLSSNPRATRKILVDVTDLLTEMNHDLDAVYEEAGVAMEDHLIAEAEAAAEAQALLHKEDEA
jgi:hypothetical protein